MTTDIAKKIKRDGDIKLRRDLEKLDEPIKAGRWTNLFFKKTGEALTDDDTYATEEEARDKADFLMDASRGACFGANDKNWMVFTWEVSHAIQMPVTGE